RSPHTNSGRDDLDHADPPTKPDSVVQRPSRWARDDKRFRPDTPPAPSADKPDPVPPGCHAIAERCAAPSAPPWPGLAPYGWATQLPTRSPSVSGANPWHRPPTPARVAWTR